MGGFEFRSAGSVVFGAGKRAELLPWAESKGRRALVVTGKAKERHAWLFSALAALGIDVTHVSAAGEPTVEDAVAATRAGRRAHVEFVIAIGGGSALDLGKAAAALVNNPGEPLDYLEVVGQGRPLTHASLPLAAVPTTSGTGSEVTRNAVLGVVEAKVKVSLRGPTLLPELALVDPELTLGLPHAVTAATACDALVQVIEPLLSCQANPLTDALCREAIRRGAPAIRAAAEQPNDLEARSELSFMSLCGGLALANSRLGAVHGFAGPLGGRTSATHGSLTARLLPATLAVNERALRARQPTSPALARLDELGLLLTGRAGAEHAIEFAEELTRDLGIPKLSALGVTRDDLDSLCSDAARSSSMKGNPIVLSPEELHEILERSL